MIALCILLACLNLTLPVLMFLTRAGKIGNNPIDDSQWQFNDKIFDVIRNNFIADKQEIIEGLLGKKSVLEIISKKDSKNGFCFVTNKAYYFLGSVYQGALGSVHHKANVQHRINADELKGVKVKRIFLYRTLFFFLLSIAIFVLDVVVDIRKYYKMLNGTDEENVFTIIFIITQIICLILIFANLLFMIFKRRTVLSFEFTSLDIYFPVGILGKQEITDFYKAVSKVQSITSSQAKAEPIRASYHETASATVGNKVGQLKELSALLEQGNISAEEFAALKAEIMGDKEATVICPECSAEIPSDAKFCRECGHKMC